MAWRRVGRIRCDADDERPATVLGLRCVYRVGLPLAQRQRNVIAIAFELGDLGDVCSSCRLPRQGYQWRSQPPFLGRRAPTVVGCAQCACRQDNGCLITLRHREAGMPGTAVLVVRVMLRANVLCRCARFQVIASRITISWFRVEIVHTLRPVVRLVFRSGRSAGQPSPA